MECFLGETFYLIRFLVRVKWRDLQASACEHTEDFFSLHRCESETAKSGARNTKQDEKRRSFSIGMESEKFSSDLWARMLANACLFIWSSLYQEDCVAERKANRKKHTFFFHSISRVIILLNSFFFCSKKKVNRNIHGFHCWLFQCQNILFVE